MSAPRLVSLVTVTVALRAIAAAQTPEYTFPYLALEPEWRFTDPVYLYLAFSDKGDRGHSITGWLHPIRNRSGWCVESFMPDEQQKARAFSYRLTREIPQGYEVTFQPIDPTEPQMECPVPGKVVTVLFSRSEQKRFTLTDSLSVIGFLGSPRPPWKLP